MEEKLVEKRKYTRYRIANKVILTPLENPRKKYKTTTFNISLGGVGINLKKAIKNTEKVRLQIFTVNSKIPVEAEGKVIWQRHLSHLRLYQAGLALD